MKEEPILNPLPQEGIVLSDGYYLPGDKAAEIWLTLHKTSHESLGLKAPLNKNERELYDSLTQKFALEAKMLIFSEISDLAEEAK